MNLAWDRLGSRGEMRLSTFRVRGVQRVHNARDTLLTHSFQDRLRLFTAQRRPSKPAPSVAKVPGSGVPLGGKV